MECSHKRRQIPDNLVSQCNDSEITDSNDDHETGNFLDDKEFSKLSRGLYEELTSNWLSRYPDNKNVYTIEEHKIRPKKLSLKRKYLPAREIHYDVYLQIAWLDMPNSLASYILAKGIIRKNKNYFLEMGTEIF